VNSQKYNAAAKTQFFDAADYHLIAHAVAGGDVVVTHEQIEHTPRRVAASRVQNGMSASDSGFSG
jgi:hypothetical protein